MINIPDLINGTFETTGGFVCFLNIRRLLKDRKVEGVDWRVSAFFSAWGFWNLFYYPHLGQWFSFLGGVGLVLTNTAWVCLALRTIRWNRHMEHKAYDPNCSLCRRALDWISEAGFPDAEPVASQQDHALNTLKNLPEIKHTYKCDCDLCKDVGGTFTA